MTPPPELSLGADGRLEARSPVAGASLGYRLAGGPWKLYTGPVPLAVGQRIGVKAVRYGWQESREVPFAAP